MFPSVMFLSVQSDNRLYRIKSNRVSLMGLPLQLTTCLGASI